MHNCHHVKDRINNFQSLDKKYFIRFSLNLPTKLLINIEQHVDVQDPLNPAQYLPVRMILAQERDIYANNKTDVSSYSIHFFWLKAAIA